MEESILSASGLLYSQQCYLLQDRDRPILDGTIMDYIFTNRTTITGWPAFRMLLVNNFMGIARLGPVTGISDN